MSAVRTVTCSLCGHPAPCITYLWRHSGRRITVTVCPRCDVAQPDKPEEAPAP